MASKPKRLPTIWNVPDDLWLDLKALLDAKDPAAPTGRPRIDPRAALDAMIYRARTGCQWNHLPETFPDDSSVHRTMQRWIALDLFDTLWGKLVAANEELRQVLWDWQAADGAMGKARQGGDAVGPNPTDRGKKWGQTQLARRATRRAAGGDRGGRQSTRHQAARANDRGRRPTAAFTPQARAASLS